MSIPVSPVPDVARAIGISWIAISTVIAAKTAPGLDTQRSLVIFIIVTFIVLFSYGLIASLQRERLDIRYLQPEAAITVQQSDSWLQ